MAFLQDEFGKHARTEMRTPFADPLYFYKQDRAHRIRRKTIRRRTIAVWSAAVAIFTGVHWTATAYHFYGWVQQKWAAANPPPASTPPYYPPLPYSTPSQYAAAPATLPSGRSYARNTKMINTSDMMLSELIQMIAPEDPKKQQNPQPGAAPTNLPSVLPSLSTPISGSTFSSGMQLAYTTTIRISENANPIALQVMGSFRNR